MVSLLFPTVVAAMFNERVEANKDTRRDAYEVSVIVVGIEEETVRNEQSDIFSEGESAVSMT